MKRAPNLFPLIQRFRRERFVYVIREEDKVKIGASIRPVGRLSTHQISNPDPLTLLITFPEYVETEREAQKRFKHLRAPVRGRGEWFFFRPEIEEWMAAIPGRTRAADHVKERLYAYIARRVHFRAPLMHLVWEETRLAAVRRRANRRMEADLCGCQLCRDKGANDLRSSRFFDGLFCAGCRDWINKAKRTTEAHLRTSLETAAAAARRELSMHDLRSIRLGELLRQGLITHKVPRAEHSRQGTR
jgi:DNA-binding transcriptional ArsR family regulator